MFEDKRSKRVVFVAHCIMNQNAKVDKCAHYPGAIEEVARFFLDNGIGISQMPCPEMLLLGLDRGKPAGLDLTIEEEDTRIARLMRTGDCYQAAVQIAETFAFQIAEYVKSGFDAIGVLGINGSPTCGVETGWYEDKETEGFGVYTGELSRALNEHGINIPIRGIKAYKIEEALQVCKELAEK